MAPASDSPKKAPASKVTPMAPAAERERVHLNSDSLHDLAGPINQVSSIIGLIEMKYGATWDTEAKALFGYLEECSKRLQNLLAGLRRYLDVAGPPAVCQWVEGDALLDSALAALADLIAKTGAVVERARLPELYCDAGQITYVLTALIDNAIKFSGEQRPQIQVGATSQKKVWLVWVRDNGIGIDARHAHRIFSTFKRIHSDQYPGVGVGLAIAQQVIERHGGRIWVESELGQGATFFFALPKKQESKPLRKRRALPKEAVA
jgi:light-regulated signal transduction histidine kinase (bacteriophytochrome)